MKKQQSQNLAVSESTDVEEELAPAGMFAFLLFGLPLILILLCEIFDVPGMLFP